MNGVNLNELLGKIKSNDAAVRFEAWRGAGPAGAAAVGPLADLMSGADKGVARAATEALQRVAHYAARPGALKSERLAVAGELLKVALSPRPRIARAQALHFLGFVGEDRNVPALARLLDDKEVREEARLALERIPGPASLRALSIAVQRAPDDFKANLRQSLYNRQATKATIGAYPLR